MNQTNRDVYKGDKIFNMKKMMICCLALVLIFPLNSLAQKQKKNYTMEVSLLPYKSPTNDAFFKVMSLRTPVGSMDMIQGFEFEWGFEYQLLVKVVFLTEPMADASDREYHLKKVISKVAVDPNEHFSLYLDANIYLGSPEPGVSAFQDLGNGIFRYYDDVEIEVPEQLLPDFQLILDGQFQGIGTFTFVNSNRIHLESIDI